METSLQQPRFGKVFYGIANQESRVPRHDVSQGSAIEPSLLGSYVSFLRQNFPKADLRYGRDERGDFFVATDPAATEPADELAALSHSHAVEKLFASFLDTLRVPHKTSG